MPETLGISLLEFKVGLLQRCAEIWVAIRGVLCFDAPEGHVLDDELFDETEAGSKETLSFCWRSLKESR